MTALAITLPLARRSPIMIPRRDIVLMDDDALALALTVVAADRPNAVSVDVSTTAAGYRLTIYGNVATYDYGLSLFDADVLLSVLGVLINGAAGRIDFTLAIGAADDWCGPLGWLLASAPGNTLAWGALSLPRPGMPA